MRRITAILFTALVVFASCDKRDLSSIETRLDNLENGLENENGRITTIEATMEQVNNDIESLQYLKSGLVINSVSGSDGAGWKITFADGKVVTVYPKDSSTNIPVISVSEDGYWLVDYCDGNGPQYLKNSSGERIPAKSEPGDPGKDGITPLLAADSDGYWTVSYDEGKTYTRLLDDKGNPIKATVSVGDSIFSSVVTEGNNVTFNLNDGSSFTCQIVSDFMCSITGVEDVVEFNAGETKTFTLQMKGIANAIVLCPQTWKAVLDNTTLKVTAPQATKAGISYDSDSSIRILATSTQGYAVITGFNVSIFIPAPEYETYYEEWVNNGFITIDGKKITADDFGSGTLVSNAGEITGSGAWFIAEGATAVYNTAWGEKFKSNTLIIGNKKGSRSKLNFAGTNGNIYLSDKVSYVLANVDVTILENVQPLFMANETYTTPLFIIDNCHIKCNGNAFCFSNRKQKMNVMSITDSEFRINANNSYLGTLGKVEKIAVDNCIFYSKDENLYDFQPLFSSDDCFDVSFTNNTIINMKRSGNGFFTGSVDNDRKTEFKPVVSNNLWYFCSAPAAGTYGMGHWTLIRSENGTWYSWNTSEVGDNYVYINGGNTNSAVFRSLLNPAVLCTNLSASPFSSVDYTTATFTNTTTYGAKR